ncbi:MAG: hypothetical protein KJ852_10720 [Gammaproteobacteria bacterium]|nr:hypothetical protein [Gammaproteobacteria bacterium]MBU0785296.1 hypothetical protein [Gammaproteobacteria bacterium]MBU0815879.1 hypothetical protein [Gammaproteobacteria bacterium]MBU1787418.1 hypothetical protein [Gammaproteobacteria bacterium]
MKKITLLLVTLLLSLSLHAQDQTINNPTINIEGTYTGSSNGGKLTGKFGGSGGGGGRCEAGCTVKEPKKDPAKPKTAAELKAEEQKKAMALIEQYLRSAYAIWNTYGSPYLTIRSVEYIGNKVFFEWATRAASMSVYGLYLALRPSEIGSDNIDPKQVNQYLDELKKIKVDDQKDKSKNIKEEFLPDNFRQPPFDPETRNQERDLRSQIFRKSDISRNEAKQVVKDFLVRNEGAPYGELVANMLEVYDQDSINQQGLSPEALAWMNRFSQYVDSVNAARRKNEPANICLIPEDRKFCTIAGGTKGERCYCNAAPGKRGIASVRATGNICETQRAYCELPLQSPMGSPCSCSGAMGMERGSVKW